jgi:hypothetical protein
VVEIGLLNIGRVLARALALLDREANCNRAGDGRNQVRIGGAVLWPSKLLRIWSPETPAPLPQNIEKKPAVGQEPPVKTFPKSRHSLEVSTTTS